MKEKDERTLLDKMNEGSERQIAIEYLYMDFELRSKLFAYLQQLGIQEDDAKDIFQDSFVILDRNIRNKKFRGESTIESYLFSICKYLSYNTIKKSKRYSYIEDTTLFDEFRDPGNEADFETSLIRSESRDLLENALSQIGELCKSVLSMWQLNYSMEEIATSNNLSSSDMAKKKRYQCHQKLIVYINTNPALKKLLKEL